MMIQTRDIRVDYGEFTAVSDVSLEIAPGEIYGLIGPNGAGKTSLIRVLATLRHPTYGEARVGGFDTVEDVAAARRCIGYMPDLAPVHDDLRCWEFLDLFAGAYYLPRSERRARVAECLERVRLTGKRNVMAGTLSRGMMQRLVLAKTLLHRPTVLLLDEPASGLDPLARMDLRDLLRELAGEGRTIVISSHILNELSEFCTAIGVMERGRVMVHGSIDTIVKSLHASRRFVVRTIDEAAAAAAGDIMRGREAVGDVSIAGTSCEIEFTGSDAEAAAMLAALVSAEIAIVEFREWRRGVEDVMRRFGSMEMS